MWRPLDESSSLSLATGSERLAVTRANANWCSEGTAIRDVKGGRETSADIDDELRAQAIPLLVGAMQHVTQGLNRPQCNGYNWTLGP